MLLPQLLALPVAAVLAWSPTTPLPDGFTGHALVSSNGWLYNIGGIADTNGVLDGNRVFAARVLSGGGVGAWAESAALPVPVFYHSAIAVNGWLYVLGGYHYADGLEVSNQVFAAKVGADGALGAWTSVSALPQPLFFLSTAYWNGRIYATGGWNGADLSNAVYSAAVNADGSLGAWTTQRALPEGVYTHAAVSDGRLYVLGGVVNGGTEIHNTVYSAKILPDGSLEAWTLPAPLPQPVSNHAAVSASGRVYVLGGWTGAAPTAQAVSAPSGADGLGAWTDEPALPKPLYMHAAAVAGGRLYVSGGTDDQATQAAVYWRDLPAAPVVAPPPPPLTTLSFGLPRAGSFVSPATEATLAATPSARATYFAVDGAPMQQYAAPFTLGTDGPHWVSFYSDNEDVRLASASVDGTAPASRLAVGAPNVTRADGSWIVSPAARFAASAEDPAMNGVASGVASLSVRVDGAEASREFALTAGGAHAIVLQARDALGNAEAPRSFSVLVDTAAPVVALSAEAGGLVRVAATDDAAGVRSRECAVDGAAAQPAGDTVAVPEGRHSVACRADDQVGNVSAWTSLAVVVDLTAPRTTLAVDGPTATLTAEDELSGVARVLYALDGAADAVYSGPLTLTEGSHALSYGAVDNAGNAEPRRTETVVVAPADREPPSSRLAWSGAGRAAVSASDAASGVAAVYAAIDDAPFAVVTDSLTIAEGAHWLRYYAVDSAGNAEPAHADAVTVDLTAPVSALSVGAPQATLADGRVVVSPATSLSVSAQDPAAAGVASGVASITLTVDGRAADASAAFSLSGDGAHAIAARATDRAGNAEAPRSFAVLSDATPPVTTLAPAKALLGAGDALTLSAVDPQAGGVASGVALTEFSVDGATQADTALTEGPHAIAWRSVDAVGNAEAWHTAQVTLDLTAPVTTLTVGSPVLRLFGQEIVTTQTQLSLAAEDAGGVERIVYAIDGGADRVYAAPFTLPAGRHTVSFLATDRAGNAEARRSETVVVGSLLVDAAAALEKLTLSGGASIAGSVRAPVVELSGKSSVSGTITRSAPADDADLDAARAFAGASQGELALSSKESRVLAGGVYRFSRIKLSGQSSLSFSGPAQVFLDGELSVSGGAELNADGAAGDLWILSAGPSVSVTGHGRAAFDLYAPQADVSFSGGGTVAGRLLGRRVSLTGHAVQPSTTALPPVARRGETRKLARASAALPRGEALARSDRAARAPEAAGPRGAAAQPAPTLARESLPPQPQSSGKGRVYAAAPAAKSARREAAPAPAAAPLERRDPPPSALSGALAGAAPAPRGGRARATGRAHLPELKLAQRAALSLVAPEGSAVRAEKAAVVVPAGAVAGKALAISVRASDDAADQVERRRRDEARDKLGLATAGEPVQFGPEGTKFEKPVTIELPFDPASAGGSLSSLAVHYWNPKLSAWEALPSVVDAQAGVVRAQTTHFSLYQVLSGAVGGGAPSGSSALEAYAYPNPARRGQTARIRVEGASGDAEFALYDQAGKKLQSGTAKGEWTVDTGALGSGVYLFTVKAAEGRRSGRLAVIK